MSVPVPEAADLCWPIDTGCCGDAWAGYTQEVRDRASYLAVQTLRMLTAYRVGGCPITVRPCALSCATGHSHGAFNPHINGQGQWVNGCGCMAACSCTSLSRIVLPGPVGRVDQVMLDGHLMIPGQDYLVTGGTLVRIGGSWPACQDLTAPDTGDGTLSVTYLNAFEPDYGAAVAAGQLACEFAKACVGDKGCQLPRGTRSVTRRGVSIELATDVFLDGVTGILQVDSWVRRWNPHHLKVAPSIVSVDTTPALRFQ